MKYKCIHALRKIAAVNNNPQNMDYINGFIGHAVEDKADGYMPTAADFIKYMRYLGEYNNFSDDDLANYFDKTLFPAIYRRSAANIKAPFTINQELQQHAIKAGFTPESVNTPFFNNYTQIRHMMTAPSAPKSTPLKRILDTEYARNNTPYKLQGNPVAQDNTVYSHWLSQLPEDVKRRHSFAVAGNRPDAYNEYNDYRQRLVTASLNPIKTRTTNAPVAPASYVPTHNADGTKSGRWNQDLEQYNAQIYKDPAATEARATQLRTNPTKANDQFEEARLNMPQNQQEKQWRQRQMEYDKKNGFDLKGVSLNDYQQVRQQYAQATTRPQGKGNYRIGNDWYNKAGDKIGYADASGNFVQDVAALRNKPVNQIAGVVSGPGGKKMQKTWNYDTNHNLTSVTTEPAKIQPNIPKTRQTDTTKI
jgi:hypothetical protein